MVASPFRKFRVHSRPDLAWRPYGRCQNRPDHLSRLAARCDGKGRMVTVVIGLTESRGRPSNWAAARRRLALVARRSDCVIPDDPRNRRGCRAAVTHRADNGALTSWMGSRYSVLGQCMIDITRLSYANERESRRTDADMFAAERSQAFGTRTMPQRGRQSLPPIPRSFAFNHSRDLHARWASHRSTDACSAAGPTVSVVLSPCSATVTPRLSLAGCSWCP